MEDALLQKDQAPERNRERHRERRVFGRRSTLWHAWIVTSPRQRLACRVRNVSLGGALLELAVPLWLPNTFDLWVEDRQLIVDCEIKHRGTQGVGVGFRNLQQARQLFALSREAPGEQLRVPVGLIDVAR
jgi:hypothetical protein